LLIHQTLVDALLQLMNLLAFRTPVRVTAGTTSTDTVKQT